MWAMTVVPGQKGPLLARGAGSLGRGSETPVQEPRIMAAAPEVTVTSGLSMPEGTYHPTGVAANDKETVMFGRRRPLLRAAAVGGGAYLAGKHVANRQAEDAQLQADQDERISQLEQQQYQAPPPQYQQPPAAPQSSSMIDQLNQLADLHQKGVLTDDEFAAAKAKLFGT